MTIDITDQPRRVQYAISGTGPYDFDFELLAQTDIAVYRDATPLALTTDYTVVVNSDGTGSITLLSATGTTLTILGARPYRRITDYAVGGDFQAATLNDELDSLQIQILQIDERVDRAIKVSPYDTAAPNAELPTARANKYLAFDASGQPVASFGTGADAGLRTDLAASSGGTLLGWIRSVANAVATTLDKWLQRRPVSAFEFMTETEIADVIAVGLSQNVASALQNWLDYLASTGKGGYLPRGWYHCGTTGLTLNVGVAIHGDGASVLHWSNTMAASALTITQPYATLRDIVFMTPTRAAPPASTVIAINVDTDSFTEDNVRVGSYGGAANQGWYIGLKLTDWTHKLISGEFVGYYNGIWANKVNAMMAFGTVAASTFGDAVLMEGGGGSGLIECDVEGTGTTCLNITDGGDASSGSGTTEVCGGYYELSSAGDVIKILGSAGPGKNVTGVSIHGAFINGLTVANAGIVANRVGALSVKGNAIFNTENYGIDIGAIAVDCEIGLDNHMESSVGGWVADRIDSAATGWFGRPNSDRIDVQGVHMNLTGASKLSIVQQTPANAAATGAANTIAFDADYIYICTAADTWKRVAVATW